MSKRVTALEEKNLANLNNLNALERSIDQNKLNINSCQTIRLRIVIIKKELIYSKKLTPNKCHSK